MNRDKMYCYLRQAGLQEGQIRKLLELGYDVAPASRSHHLAVRGGLVAHSLNVTDNILKLSDAFGYTWSRNSSPYIVGMLHDIVKCKSYKEVSTGVYERVFPGWSGHGEASVMIALQELGVALTTSEIQAIRNHMGLWDVEGNGKRDYEQAVDRYAQEIIITHTADWWASQVDEKAPSNRS